MMPKFATFDVERSRTKLVGLGFNLARPDENKLGLRVNELLDEPRAGDSVHFDCFARNPFHSGPW